VRPIHIGSSTQIWQTRIQDDQGRLVCISRLTMAVLDHRRNGAPPAPGEP
jgi:acyl-coenzyme A thioesterase PaaI-like protein